MTIQRIIEFVATERLARCLVPARLRNRAFRIFINQLTNEAKTNSNPSEIFLTPAMRCDRGSTLKVASVVSGKDLEMLLWCLKSLFLFSACLWDLWIIDGGLNNEDVKVLEEHFPGAHICLEPNLTLSLRRCLAGYPQISQLRLHRKYAPAKKLIDAPWLLRNHKFLLVDPDVLFFRYPIELIDRLRRPETTRFAFNMDKDKGRGINSGLAIVPSLSVCFTHIEEALDAMPPTQKQQWWIEQDVYARIARNCFDELSSAYAVEPVEVGDYNALVSCHFIHTCRHHFYQHGIKQLRSAAFLEKLRNSTAQIWTSGSQSAD
jgi:hypothetical protein